eukprot:TRINITY_DN12768_c0_g2_i1.p1 TRINITY_DN12768_c0_g2~~TRINITY_DN12768_c0_g2_i1.p1  ORF type:complete len:1285 (+),score=291.58 TRINITY_DN12768_c0_g2_i1:560-3856(+)
MVARRDKVRIQGGRLRTAVGLFNSDEAQILGPLDSTSATAEALKQVKPEQYTMSARFKGALEQCRQAALADPQPNTTRYCVIMGDNEAMCERQDPEVVTNFCAEFKNACPDDMHDHGNMLEYAEELQLCSDYIEAELTDADMNVIMMLTAGSSDPSESSLRLRSKGFRSFVEKATSCRFTAETVMINVDGMEVVQPVHKVDDDCLRFMMVSDFSELMEKSHKLAELLKTEDAVQETPTANADGRFWLFLLLPLNLVFYIIWTKIIQFTTNVQNSVQKAMGAKRKMVKVTKTLVEKQPAERMSVAAANAGLTEMELAQVVSSRPFVPFGEPMTMRARLRGAYVRENISVGECDGNGGAFEQAAFWCFEPAGGSSGPSVVQPGQRVRIRGNDGRLMAVTADGLGLAAAGEAQEFTEFVLESVANDDVEDAADEIRLGDTVRVRSCATGEYVRVHKDGKCDVVGRAEHTETQIQLDRGGRPLTSGAVVAIGSLALGESIRATAAGQVNCVPAGGNWHCWKIEKTDSDQASGSFPSSPRGGAFRPQASEALILKHGDVVTLRAINQKQLEVNGNGCLECSAASSSSGSSIRSQQFVVERTGMALQRKKDDVIRSGMEINLRPVSTERHVQVDEDGNLMANGTAMSPEARFKIASTNIQELVAPLVGDMERGDAYIKFSPLWNKNEIKRVGALTAPWINEEDLPKFRGAVVVATQDGRYNVPKAKGAGDEGWVAVVGEGVDLLKAAQQAKGHGANALIVRCEGGLSLQKLARNPDGDPCLPVVYVDDDGGKELEERGITLKGCEFRKAHLSRAMRNLGESVGDDDDRKAVNNDIFDVVGQALVEHHETCAAEVVPSPMPDIPDDGDDGQGNFKWKVTSNTHYLWSKSGGGATRVDVNFGAKAPPSALKKLRVDAETGVELATMSDASQHHVLPSAKPRATRVTFESGPAPRQSVTAVTLLNPEDVRSHRLDQQLTALLTTDAAALAEVEQLDDESDFKIEYNFEEVEVAVGQPAEDVEDEELIEFEAGTVVGSLAVPRSRFWIVGLGLVASTLLLAALFVYLIATDFEDVDGDGDVNFLDAATAVMASKLDAGAPSFLSTARA